ncbi:MAG: hypothetical protein PHE15_06890 [Dehalococcoidales bacterium]|nr:hypothetical protein [Dehalococcoidales bacterium]
MSKKWKLVIFILSSYLVLALLFIALSDKVFFFTQQLKAESTVYIAGDGYEYYFYNIGSDKKAVTVYYDIEKGSEDLIHIILKLTPKIHTQIDSLFLGFENLLPSSALLLEDPSGDSTIPYSYHVTYSESVVTIDFSDFDTVTNEAIELQLWVDTTSLSSEFSGLFVMSFSMYSHEDSVFKIWRYHGQSAVQLNIP